MKGAGLLKIIVPTVLIVLGLTAVFGVPVHWWLVGYSHLSSSGSFSSLEAFGQAYLSDLTGMWANLASRLG